MGFGPLVPVYRILSTSNAAILFAISKPILPIPIIPTVLFFISVPTIPLNNEKSWTKLPCFAALIPITILRITIKTRPMQISATASLKISGVYPILILFS
eukprot:NODE_62_length_26495_cov_0.832853.p21 type:complete len:100 gc:universal NODE_62_length_26495_cov_0.832853:23414-23713(+)